MQSQYKLFTHVGQSHAGKTKVTLFLASVTLRKKVFFPDVIKKMK